MQKTILMAGLLAGLVGTAPLAQTATTPEASETGTAAPGAETGDAGNGFARAGHGGLAVPGLAPIESYDADGNGSVTQEEIETGRAERFSAADADGDRALSPEELIAMEEGMREEARLARATAIVTRMDDNGDGLLQVDELQARAPQTAPLFDELDTDNDGGISEAELEARHRQQGDGGFGRGGHRRGDRQDHRGGFMSGLFGG